LVAAVVLALPLPVAAGTGQSGETSTAPAHADATAQTERPDGVLFTALDVALVLGGATLVVGLGFGVRRFARARA
jgi:hypothetical protein